MTISLPSLTLSQARRLALAAGAGFERPSGRGPSAVAALVDRIGFVQIDTISVVERAHHHIVAARLPGYKTEWLAQAPVFEYWAHAAAYLPWRDFRHTLPRKERIRANGHDWFRTDAGEAGRVLERIRAEGPLMARDFEAPRRTGGWWDWKPAKRALEYLFMAGELMVLPRQGFQKVFDLTERVLPPGTDTRSPTPPEHAAWYVERALDAWGLAARDELAYQRKEHLDSVDGVLRQKEEDGIMTRVTVGEAKTVYWVRTSDLDRVDSLPRPGRELRVLSPFDPFLIHRKRINRLFGFDFSIECYVPAEKRVFGYFALPLLQGDSFLGLLDAKADRINNVLELRRVRYDGPPKKRAAFEAALSKALEKFAAFNGVQPPRLKIGSSWSAS
jgi:uncharacterized protein YcaQ